MTARTLIFATMFALATVVPGGLESDAYADPPPFGPVSSAGFYFHPGTTIEQPKEGCGNADAILIRGPGLGNAKSFDISPKTSITDRNVANTDKYNCKNADCLQITIKLSPSDAVGTRTVTMTSTDGRTVTTTFEVVANAGRCDYQTGKK